MLLNPLKLILLIFLYSYLSACGENLSSQNSTSENTVQELGTKVLELDNQIWNILQDSRGHYWFGSKDNGLYHKKENTLKRYTTEDGLTHNQIRGIQEDHLGNIFIETSKGISKYDGEQFSTLEVIKSSKNTWKLEPKDLWFGCYSEYIYRYDGTSLIELRLPKQDLRKVLGEEKGTLPLEDFKFSPYTVYGLEIDKEGHLWIGTESAGAYRYNGASFIWFGEKELSVLPDGRVPAVRSMIQDKEGYFWLSNFISKYRICSDCPDGYEKLKAVDLSEDLLEDKLPYFNSGLSDKSGDLWMITYGGGVWLYDGHSFLNTEIHNGKETVLLVSIYEDRDGILWLGTDNDGVYREEGEGFVKYK